MIMEVASIVVGLILMAIGCTGEEGFMPAIAKVIDIPTLLLILVLSVPVLFKNGLGKDFLRAFKLLRKDYTCRLSELRRTLDAVEMMQKQVIYAGFFTGIFSCLYLLSVFSEPEQLGPYLAITLLSGFYAVTIEMLLLPLQIEVKRRIIDYIEIEEE